MARRDESKERTDSIEYRYEQVSRVQSLLASVKMQLAVADVFIAESPRFSNLP